MKKIILLFSVFIASHAFAQIEPIHASSTIKEVTVYLKGAVVTRTGKANLVPGNNEVIFEGLGAGLDPNSIQLEGGAKATILSVNYQNNYLKGHEKSKEEKSLEVAKDTLTLKLEGIINERRALEEELAVMQANHVVQGADKGGFRDELEDAASFYRSHMPELLNKISAISRKEANLGTAINNIAAQIQSISSKNRKYTGEIKVIMSCTEYVKLDFKLKYFVYNAGWVPSYGMRSGTNSKEVQLDYDADVMQNSGEDWNDVHLTLCSGNPTLGGVVPELSTWFISFNRPEWKYNKNKWGGYEKHQEGDANDYYSDKKITYQDMDDLNSYRGNKVIIKGSANDGYIQDKDSLGRIRYVDMDEGRIIKKTGEHLSYGATNASQNQINVCFDINLNETVISDNIARHVRIQQNNLPAAFTYKAVPKLDKDAFLVAQVTGWDALNLLPGDASVFMDGSFVGKTFLNTTETTDTLDLSFGRDKRINIKCTKLKDFSKKQFLSGTVKQTFRKSIDVRNTRNFAVDIIIEEQIPVTTDKAIEVVLDESSKADYDASNGKLSWKLSLKPNENISLPFQYTVKYPKGKTVYGLY